MIEIEKYIKPQNEKNSGKKQFRQSCFLAVLLATMLFQVIIVCGKRAAGILNLLEFFFLFALSRITQQLVILPLYSNNSPNHKVVNCFLIERVVNVFSLWFTVLFETRILDWINCGSVNSG